MNAVQKIGRARNARINQAIKHTNNLLINLQRLQGLQSTVASIDKDAWQDARNELEQLVQCVHEANSYNNALASINGQ